MADFGAPVAQNAVVNPMQGVETLSSLIGLKQKQQQLQTGQYLQQSARSAAQQAQQDAGQRAAMAQVDWSKHTGEDGTLDLNSFNKDQDIRKSAGDFYPDVLKKAADIKQSQVAAKQSLTNLTNDQIGAFARTVGGLAGDKDVQQDTAAGRQKALSAIQGFAQSYGPDAAKAVAPYASVLQNAPPGKLGSVLQHIQMQSVDAGKQVSAMAPTPTTIDTGGTIQPGATDSALSDTPGDFHPQGPAITKTLSPGVSILSDSYGKQYRYNTQSGRVEPVGGSPAAGTQGQGGFNQPVADQPHVLESIENARAVGDQAPGVRNVNSQLLKLSQETETGGWGTHTAQQIAATVGLPSGSRFQEIGAYLDRQAAMQARSMGVPNTNAGLAAAERASGTTDYTPKALQEKVKFADALNSGTMAYRQGLDKAIGTGGTPDLSKYQAFRSAWAKNFDPDVFRVEDAQRRGDKQELAELKKRLGPEQMKDLAAKSANLRQLESGQIPQ